MTYFLMGALPVAAFCAAEQFLSKYRVRVRITKRPRLPF